MPQLRDGPADLVEVPVAAVAQRQVLDEPLLGLLVERVFQVCGDQLDELVASHAAHLVNDRSSAARTAARARCSSTRWLAVEISSIAHTSSAVYPSTSRSVITIRWRCGRAASAAPSSRRVSVATAAFSGDG